MSEQMQVRRRTILVCSTCGGELRGRTCENRHNAYPAARVEFAEIRPIVDGIARALNVPDNDYTDLPDITYVTPRDVPTVLCETRESLLALLAQLTQEAD